jgi:diguanylate cyclase (GGDEF)-like protein
MPTQPEQRRMAAGLRNTEQIQQHLKSLYSRDLQLWSIGALITVLLAGALCAIVVPQLAWNLGVMQVDTRYLPQLLLGLIVLIILCNCYIIGQKSTLNSARHLLIQELVRNERLQNLSLIDPLTQLLNHRATGELIAREISRANRLGHDLSLLLIEVCDSKPSFTCSGQQTTDDDLLIEAAQLIRATYRGSDLVFRYSGNEFLVVMSDTNELQAEVAVQRFSRELDNWNVTSGKDYEMAVTWVIAAYVRGESVERTLDRVGRKMQSVHGRQVAPMYV